MHYTFHEGTTFYNGAFGFPYPIKTVEIWHGSYIHKHLYSILMPHVPLPPNETLLLVVLHVMSHHAFDNDATNPSPDRAIQLHRVNARVPLCKAILTQSPWWNALDNMKMEYNQVTTNHVLCSRTPFGSGITHMEWPPLPLMAFKYT